MQASSKSSEPSSGVARTVGFWLGPVLFVGLLLVPPPESMHDAARECFAEKLPPDVAAILTEWEQPQARFLGPITSRGPGRAP